MAASKVGLTFEKSAAFRNGGDITWCKHICGFPHPRTYSPEYRAWRNAMKRKMEQDKIPGWRQSTAAQWAAIQAYSLTLPPISNRAGLWETNTPRGERFTECLNFLLKDIAKKHKGTLADRLSPQPVAAADPAPARNDRKLPKVSVLKMYHIC